MKILMESVSTKYYFYNLQESFMGFATHEDMSRKFFRATDPAFWLFAHDHYVPTAKASVS